MLTLTIEKRKKTGKTTKDASEERMPAVLYGRKETSTPIFIARRAFDKVWKEAGESSVITLTGLEEDKEALIHDVDVHPVSDQPRHVDFYVIEKGKKVRVSVALEFVGEAPAAKELGGAVVKVMHEIEIEALPKDLPQHLEVDLSRLKDFESRITAADIKLPGDIQMLTSADEVIALATEAVEEVIEEDTEAPDLSAIEVEKKGKEEEEAAEGGKDGETTDEKSSK